MNAGASHAKALLTARPPRRPMAQASVTQIKHQQGPDKDADADADDATKCGTDERYISLVKVNELK